MESASLVITGVILVAVFLMVLTTSLKALKAMSFFGPGSQRIIAFCTAVLSALGLVEFFAPPARSVKVPSAPTPLLNGVLLPYTALGLTLLVLFVLSLFRRAGTGGEKKRTPDGYEPHDRPHSERGDVHEPKRRAGDGPKEGEQRERSLLR